ncbi:MAG: hypothetical protein HZC54_00715 [Verrucomicrobia bacterium]|nr:hypothetical protein [Verrucomicrobiota bacterium]
MKRLIAVMTMAVTLMSQCRECPAQTPVGPNQSAEVTLTNSAAIYVGLTNCPSSVGTPLVTSLFNLGGGALEYTWYSTGGVWRPLAGGASVNIGPVPMVDGVIYIRLMTTTNTVARCRRELRK